MLRPHREAPHLQARSSLRELPERAEQDMGEGVYEEKEMKKKTKEKLKEIIEKYPDIPEQIILDLYEIGYGRGFADSIKKLQVDNLETTKQFIEGVFLSGVQVGLMKNENNETHI